MSDTTSSQRLIASTVASLPGSAAERFGSNVAARFKVDGEWRDNPEASRKIPNPYGTQNCVLTVE